jgi:rRNA maturation endonuclease Nob1
MKTKKCKDCGKEFEYTPSRYERKYCKKCGDERRKAYENIHLIKAEDCEDA